ncbi:hypothetical protein CKAH01_17064 [Colletotrichum kahawae]|uniref:Uncharacterized protein n=1 Tax=Colletotrichum kahawae TaxID=34407 RepID=A0AAD9YFA8_COLKA|nr:hypothetical protein CKAH01_17064 [Colletotrichum kahawae]
MEVGAMVVVVVVVTVEHEMGNGRAGNNGQGEVTGATACLDMTGVSRRLVLQPRALCRIATAETRKKRGSKSQAGGRKVQRCMMLGPASLHLRSFRDPSPMGRCTSDACSELLSICSRQYLLTTYCVVLCAYLPKPEVPIHKRLIWSTDALMHRCTRNKSHAQDGIRKESDPPPRVPGFPAIIQRLHLLLASTVVIISIDAPLCAGQESGTRAKENLSDWAGPNPATRVLFLLDEFPIPSSTLPSIRFASPFLLLQATQDRSLPCQVKHARETRNTLFALCIRLSSPVSRLPPKEQKREERKKDSTPVFLAIDQSTGPFPNPAHITADIQLQLHLKQAAFLLLASASPRFNSARKQQTSWTSTRHIQS